MSKTVPDKVVLKLDKPYYTGSVQGLYEVPDYPGLLISETTAGGSVFDVGTIFNIEGSDIGRAGFRHLVFQELQSPEAWNSLSERFKSSNIFQKDNNGLVEKVFNDFCKNGADTHHMGMIERESGKVHFREFPAKLSNLTLIRKYEVIKPDMKKVLGWHFYDYKKYHGKDRNVIPLEYIVRLGITSGSSILKKYEKLNDSGKAAYLNELGIETLIPWTRFDPPVVDLTTKYEPEDRNLSRQEAALISSLDGNTFARSLVMAALGAYLLQQIFSKMGLSLWDMKWEIAKDGDKLVFVDTIDTDSVRVTYDMKHEDKLFFIHFNKQAMRDYYRIMHGEWLNAVNDSKKIAAKTGRPFTEVLSEGQQKGDYPGTPDVERDFLDIQKAKFNMIMSFIRDQEQDLNEESERIAQAELEYYFSRNKKEQYEAVNSLKTREKREMM